MLKNKLLSIGIIFILLFTFVSAQSENTINLESPKKVGLFQKIFLFFHNLILKSNGLDKAEITGKVVDEKTKIIQSEQENSGEFYEPLEEAENKTIEKIEDEKRLGSRAEIKILEEPEFLLPGILAFDIEISNKEDSRFYPELIIYIYDENGTQKCFQKSDENEKESILPLTTFSGKTGISCGLKGGNYMLVVEVYDFDDKHAKKIDSDSKEFIIEASNYEIEQEKKAYYEAQYNENAEESGEKISQGDFEVTLIKYGFYDYFSINSFTEQEEKTNFFRSDIEVKNIGSELNCFEVSGWDFHAHLVANSERYESDGLKTKFPIDSSSDCIKPESTAKGYILYENVPNELEGEIKLIVGKNIYSEDPDNKPYEFNVDW